MLKERCRIWLNLIQMMNQAQLALLCQLLKIDLDTDLAHELLSNKNAAQSAQAKALIDWHKKIKEHYVAHRPTLFKVMVGHHDMDRFPGALDLQIGDYVQLVALTTERYIPVQIKELPKAGSVYYRGTITKQLVQNSLFEEGDSVYFSEDQVNTTLIK